MHPNSAFRQTSAAANLAFARARGFGMLTLNGPEGPLAAHVPFLIDAEGTALDLHLARSNPIARAPLPASALMAVSGPDAYISPDWYGVADQVPTWNYVAVHLRGTLAAAAARDPARPRGGPFGDGSSPTSRRNRPGPARRWPTA